MPKVSPEDRKRKVRLDADSAKYAADALAKALDADDLDAALEAAKMLEAVGCRARRYVGAVA